MPQKTFMHGDCKLCCYTYMQLCAFLLLMVVISPSIAKADSECSGTSRSSLVSDHCVCPRGLVCHGRKCTNGHGADVLITGWGVGSCDDCVCRVPGEVALTVEQQRCPDGSPDPTTIPTHYCYEYWLVLRATLPCARVAVDIGANKGYSGATLMGLYNPAFNVSPQAWWTAPGTWGGNELNGHRPTNGDSSKRFSCGVCRDCEEKLPTDLSVAGLKLHMETVFGASVAETIVSTYSSSCPPNQLVVHSFDGQKVLRNMTEIKQRNFPGIERLWHYNIRAFSSTSGQTNFLQGGGWEMAKVQENKAIDPNSDSVVPMSTVDSWASDHDVIDILKIDTEGHDFRVIDGALNTIATKVYALVFEVGHHPKGPDDITLVQTINKLADRGFVCYVTTNQDQSKPTNRFGPLTRLTGCLTTEFESGLGNIYCGHIERSTALLATFDAMCV